MKSNARINARVSALIDDVRSYANPTGQYPTPPTDRSSKPRPFVGPAPSDQTGPDRARPPDWFAPRDALADAPNADADDDVPAISDEIEAPQPSASEEHAISTAGVEALAFYAPFHFYQQHQWGIYIRDYGVVYLASRFLRRQRLAPADNWVLRCAYEFLVQHEYFHFQTEIAVSRYEILMFQESPLPMYLDKVYLHHFLDRQSSWFEEAVANAKAYREFSRQGTIAAKNQIDDFKLFLALWMKTQPDGYRDYDRWNGRAGMMRGRSAIVSQLHRSLAHWRWADQKRFKHTRSVSRG